MESGPLLDSAIAALDRGLRSVFAPARTSRPVPGGSVQGPDSPPLPVAERRASAALMRVNHAGELAAQALYHGQAFVAQLAARPSLLNPLWYAGSFAIGAAAALMGDRASLGFVAETERQVEGHLDDHLGRLPASDTRSRAILETMRAEEIAHGAAAAAAGGAPLPAPVCALMRYTARVMTGTAYWV